MIRPVAQRIVAFNIIKPPLSDARDLLQQSRFDVDHSVAPAAVGFGFARVKFVRVHGHKRIYRRDMIGTAITKALGSPFNGADAEGFMGMRFESKAGNMRVIKLDARDRG